MSNHDKQKKDKAGASSDRGESTEVTSTSTDSPVAGVSEKPKYTEEAESYPTDDHLPDSSINSKKLVSTRTNKSNEPSQQKGQSGPGMTKNGPGQLTDTLVIEISDDDTDSDSSTETSPESSPQPSPKPSTESDDESEHFEDDN